MATRRIVKVPPVANVRYTIVVPRIESFESADEDLAREREVEMPSFFDDEAAEEDAAFAHVDVESIELEARRLLVSAEADAHAILIDARDRASSIIETATSGASEVEQKAHDDGYEAGYRSAQEEVERELGDALASLCEVVESLRAARRSFIESAEPEVVRLAMAIAERILHQQVAVDPNVVVEMTKAALSRLVDRETITIRVNPQDLETMRAHREDVLALGEVKQMHIIEDKRVDRGGVIIETEAGAVDAKMVTQTREARRVLNIEDELTVAQAAKGASG